MNAVEDLIYSYESHSLHTENIEIAYERLGDWLAQACFRVGKNRDVVFTESLEE